MTTKNLEANADLSFYANHLIKLHQLLEEGRCDSDEADGVRDEMDGPWRKLNSQQIARVRGLSADLYTLGSDSPIKHPETVEVQCDEFRDKLRSARSRDDYNEVLTLLREEPQYMAAQRAAVLRDVCYEYLGQQDVAILFYEHAAKICNIDADDSNVVFLLIRLHHIDQTKQAVHWTHGLLQCVSDPSARLLVTCADVFSPATENLPEDEMQTLLERTVRLLDKVRAIMKASLVDSRLQGIAIHAHIRVGFFYQQLGDLESALQAFEGALDIDPKDDLALEARTLILDLTNAIAAAKHFTEEIDQRNLVNMDALLS